jgi:esterase/lipase superfamily enzyme
MHFEQTSWWSPSLGQEMACRVYGHAGKPMVVFPAQGGNLQEYEGFGMIDQVRPWIDRGQLQVICADGLDHQTWVCESRHPADRARRANDYDRYIVDELVPFIWKRAGRQRLMTTGCSMGAYHCANFFFRHPAIFDTVISLSGVYRLKLFIGDYMDDNVYYHTPLAFLPNLNDPKILDLYRQSQIIICVGQGAWEEPMLEDTFRLREILQEKGVPAWIDVWGHDVAHDWPWWRKMIPYFLEHLLGT